MTKLAIVCAKFNEPVTSRLLTGAQKRLEEKGFDLAEVPVYQVPGAVEIPIVVQRLAENTDVDAVIALGAVIRGETSHYDYVCEQVSQGCQRIMLDYDMPVVFGVLTTENAEQAFARTGGEHSDKGVESVDCALEMLEVLDSIPLLDIE